MNTRRLPAGAGAARRVTRVLAAALALVLVPGCTNLDEDPSGAITPNNFNQTEREVNASLAGIYAGIATADNNGALWSYYNLSEISSDEMIVPTRGQDWFDNGRWLEIQRQTWTANSPSGLDDINGAWTVPFRGVTLANTLLAAIESVAVPEKDAVIAEIKTLRAFYYYMLMDLFGGVPLHEDTISGGRARNTRSEIFDFVTRELTATYADLPLSRPATAHGRMTKGAAAAILASTYLNAGVFTTETPNAAAYNSCISVQVAPFGTACDAAVAWSDSILNSGQYSLATDWHSNFAPDNSSSPENILVAKHSNETGLGLNFVMRALHYNQFSPTPWNGFAALAETYNAFDADDIRRQIFLEGPQLNLDTGEPATERDGTPLIFTVDIQDETQAGEGEGTRIVKYPLDPNRNAQNNGNDFVYFRLGEIYLIKAEASLEGGNAGEALTLVNDIRARVFDPDKPLASIDRDAILQERLFELTAEAKRRQDLIRHGKYTDPWSFKQQGAATLVLMPIPQSQIDANPLLTQNPGY